MTTDANEKLQRIDEQLDNLRETARTLEVEVGENGSSDLGARVGTLRGALEGLRSDVQEVREDLEA